MEKVEVGLADHCVQHFITYSVLVEEVEDHVGQPGIAPVSVDQKELLKVSETRQSKVARHHRLHKTTHAHTEK